MRFFLSPLRCCALSDPPNKKARTGTDPDRALRISANLPGSARWPAGTVLYAIFYYPTGLLLVVDLPETVWQSEAKLGNKHPKKAIIVPIYASCAKTA